MKIILLVILLATPAWGDSQQDTADAQRYFDDPRALTYLARKDRAIILTAKDELNLLRDWIMQFKAEVADATSLADLKARVAGLPNMPQRTSGQAKTAIQNKIADQDAD